MNPGEAFTAYPLGELLRPPPDVVEPEDFDQFWTETFKEHGSSEVDWWTVREAGSTEEHHVEEIRFLSSCDEAVTAWLAVPHEEANACRGLVISHGYGGRSAPDLDRVPAGSAAIFPCAPGLPANQGSRFPALGSQHVLYGLADRETYSHRFSAADIWRAATVLLDRAPAAAQCLDYIGGSFGGGIGALALPWDDRFRRASLDVPSFGHFPLRLTRSCTGSGEAVRQWLQTHPEARSVLDYFDSTIAARRIRIPVHVGAALLDPAVDPRGQSRSTTPSAGRRS